MTIKTLAPALAELSAIHTARVDSIASATLSVRTSGESFFEITREVARFLEQVKARDGVVLIYLKHTSASLVIQENADPDVRTDLVTALERIAPVDAGWIHQVEGPDDMPAHVKSMVNGVSLAVPVGAGKLQLGTWQGIFIAEHRRQAHRREVTLQFLGSCDEARGKSWQHTDTVG
jgi:secondary thiamine-phosphate synthase enzyme